ncbi:MAG: 23S rRNA (uracil(1939)-C(5))-methyltransferase RlmD [Lachnospiraceae bacterium]|nr:23S rRNA (uracil(1939)-C(5))-methyltransferase RlmD [Lachnospiraceae bacterium]
MTCKYFAKCGGCAYIDRPYSEQLKLKDELIGGRLGKLAAACGCQPEPVIAADDSFYYRNKVHSVFSRDRKGNIIRGMYEEDSHRVVNVSGCLTEDRTADAVIEEIRRIASKYRMKIYDEDTGYGFLRHVLVRTAQYKGKASIMVVVVTAQVQFEGKNNFIKLIRTAFPEITTIVQNINDRQTSMILGERNITLFGKGYVVDDSLGFEFRISPSSFFQINTAQTKKLYELALKMADPGPDDTVLDAYCGTGTIGMFMSRSAGRVIGVELNRDAVKDAIDNARRNGIDNIQFVCADATKYMLGADTEPVDILVMDPPRSGSTKEFIDAAAKSKIPVVIYVSCEPETLERDLKMFVSKGYRIERIAPVDMFPQTKKCEAVVRLSLNA